MRPSKTIQAVLGLSLGLVVSVALWSGGADPVTPAPIPTVAVPDSVGALDRILLHFTPSSAGMVEATYSQLLSALDPRVEVLVAVEQEADLDRLRELLARHGVERPLRPVVIDLPITTWSRDRFTLARTGERWTLVVPAASDGAVQARVNDWMVPFEVARVLDDVDVCLGTEIPEDVPTRMLLVFHYALTDGDTTFDSRYPAHWPFPIPIFTTTDTAGCSCDQIIDEVDLPPGLAEVQRRFGCSVVLMKLWVLYQQANPDPDDIDALWNELLRSEGVGLVRMPVANQ